MNIEGLIAVETGEPASINTQAKPVWLVFVTHDSIQAVFELQERLAAKKLKHEVYGVEAQGLEIPTDRLGPEANRFFYLNDEGLLESLQVEDTPWFACVHRNNLLYSSQDFPQLPVKGKPIKSLDASKPARTPTDSPQRRTPGIQGGPEDLSAFPQGYDQELGQSGEHLTPPMDPSMLAAQGLVPHVQEAMQHRQQPMQYMDEPFPPMNEQMPPPMDHAMYDPQMPEPMRATQSPQSKGPSARKSTRSRPPPEQVTPPKQREAPGAPSQRNKRSAKPEASRRAEAGQSSPALKSPGKSVDPEVRQLKQRVSGYETRIKEYQQEVHKLKERLAEKDHEIETLQRLLENKRSRKPLASNDQFKLDEKAIFKAPQMKNEDLDFWKMPDDNTLERGVNFDEIAQSKNLWIASIEKPNIYGKPVYRSTEKTQLAKLNLEKQRQEHALKTSPKKRPTDDRSPARGVPKIPQIGTYSRTVRKY